MAVTSILSHQDKARARLAKAIRSAYPVATGEQRLDLERIQILVRAGQMTVADASERVADLRRRQQLAA